MELVYQYMAILFNFSPISNHLHPLQATQFVVDEGDNGKCRLERFESVLLVDQITVIENKRFANICAQFKQIWVILSHLKLWVAVARHNFMWVKI